MLFVAGGLAGQVLAPWLVARGLRRELAASGYPDAQFEVASVGLGAMRLDAVELAPGLALGQIELDVGLSGLWGDRPRSVTMRDGRIDLAATSLVSVRGAQRGAALPFEYVRIERLAITHGKQRVSLSGDITLPSHDRPLAIDLTTAGSLNVAGLALENIALHARQTSDGVHACASARAGVALGEACATLPASLSGSFDASWQARADGKTAAWTASGRGRLDLDKRELVRSHTDVAISRALVSDVELDDATLALEVSGRLATGELAIEGRAHAARVIARSSGGMATARDVDAPLAMRVSAARGSLAVTARAAEATAREARVERGDLAITLARPTLAVTLGARAKALHWRAEHATARGARARRIEGAFDFETGTHTIGWRALELPRFALDDGLVVVRRSGDAIEVESARVGLAGGSLAIAPFRFAGAPVDITIQLHDIALAKLLPGRVQTNAVVEGELAVGLDRSALTIQRGELRTRRGGRIRIADRALRDRATKLVAGAGLERRLLGALVDFRFSTLDASLAPRGVEPELRVHARGHGVLVPQHIDLDIDVRGLRESVEGLAFHHEPGDRTR